jgi:fatty-acyl-CoA synthase
MDHAPPSLKGTDIMQGLIQYQPLLLSGILEHAHQSHGDVPIVSAYGDQVFRYTYAEAALRARRLASSLRRLGLGPNDVVGSLAWTTHRHFELMYAAPGIGVVLHTANPRLSTDHISYSVKHAGERILFVDVDCIAQAEALASRLTAVDTYVILCAREDVPPPRLPNVLYYEDLIAAGDELFTWPELDERSASTLCFTSGTTGDPKGVLYSHRGSYLSTLSIAAANVWGVSRDDAVIIVAPFFHCNGWGATYLAPMCGAKLILPGRALDGRSLQRLIVNEGATVGPGVPTVWLSVLEYCRAAGVGLGKLNRIICGGAAPPLALMRALYSDFGIRTTQVWGMTETTHAATVLQTSDEVLRGDAEPTGPQGSPVFGTQIRIIDSEGNELPKDGNAIGHLQVKAHWCASAYLGRPDAQINDEDGWLNTGDAAAIEPGNAIRITDRLKDVIKSGGEWISSIDLENAAMGHAAVAEAAVVGVPHPRWQERPVMFVVRRASHSLSADELRAFLARSVAKWWLPDDVVFVSELPHASTGKVKKDILRATYRAQDVS